MDNDKPYIVGVRSRNSAGDSVWRNSSSIGRYEPPPPLPKPPSAPTGLSATGSDKSVTLSWNKPPGDVTGYQFRLREAPPGPAWGKWYTVPEPNVSATYYTIRGLENGTEYRFKLRAVNSGAVSVPAPTSAPWYVSATPDPNVQPPPPPKPPSAPPAPSSVTATRGNGAIVASWYHSEGATGYDVRYSTDNGGTWKFAAWGWNTSVITIKGASGSKSYIVGVRAVNLVGASDWTNSNTVPALPDPEPQTVSVSNLDETQKRNCLVGRATASHQCAIAFSTGDRSSGYTLKDITARFIAKVGSPGDIVAKLHAPDTMDTSSPASSSLVTSLVTLTGSNPDTAGLHTYVCPDGNAGCDLSASETYFIVMSAGDTIGNNVGYYWGGTISTDETVHPSGNGWSIADSARRKHGVFAWSNWGENASAFLRVTAVTK